MNPSNADPIAFSDFVVRDPLVPGGYKIRAPLGFTGEIKLWGIQAPPAGWLVCDGSALNRQTYGDLFRTLNPFLGNPTITIATPGVVTLTSHGLSTGDTIYLTTSGALPTGLTSNTIYYVVKVTADTFSLATTRANADAGTKIATSGSQSGTHNLFASPYGIGDGSTTFTLPDARGRSPIGAGTGTSLTARRLGETGGEENHILTTAEMPSHNHLLVAGAGAAAYTRGSSIVHMDDSANDRAPATANTGGGGSHNTMHPWLGFHYIIKT